MNLIYSGFFVFQSYFTAAVYHMVTATFYFVSYLYSCNFCCCLPQFLILDEVIVKLNLGNY